jgi:hypothetical protein
LLKASGEGILGCTWAIRAPEYASAFSRTIEAMLFRRIRPMSKPMSPEVRSATPAEPTGYESLRLRTNWSERIVTVVATSLGVLIVAMIAVLMGMA